MYICRALFKDGYSNFSLTILEYCSPDKCLIREKHYWDILNPEYNIAKDPTAPMSGRKHSDESKLIMSDAKKGNTNAKNNPNSQVIEVTDITNNTTICYDSIREAARALNI